LKGLGDWGSYGNLLQYNFVHDITSELAGYGIHGFYLDGCLSGPSVDGNVLYNFAGTAIFHNGGHDVTMTNNVVVSCSAALETTSACDSDAGAQPVCNVSPNYLSELVALRYQQDPWATTYPTCAAVPDDCATLTASGSPWITPYGTSFTDNVSFQNQAFYSADSPTTLTYYSAFDNNLQNQDPLFVDVATENFNLQAGSPALALPGFTPIPFDSIGIVP
jgi:hypothetical protein